MKISKLFHYLYAAIMFLPLIVIPVFMIYSHRHILTERTEVDIQYRFQTNEVIDASTDLVNGNVYLFTFNLTYGTESTLTTLYTNNNEPLYYKLIEAKGSIVPYEYNETGYINTLQYKPTWLNTGNDVFKGLDNEYILQYEFVSSGTLAVNQRNGYIKMALEYNNFYNQTIFDDYVTVIALPTQYNEEIIDVQDTNSDIMSVTIESFNNIIDNYFNMKRVFNLNDLYNWFNVNFFNNASPISFNILFNLFTYWLFVSLLWLLFDAFMYIPLIMHNAIDKARIE